MEERKEGERRNKLKLAEGGGGGEGVTVGDKGGVLIPPRPSLSRQLRPARLVEGQVHVGMEMTK